MKIVEPDEAKGVRKAIEKFNTLFKAHVVLPFPGFHARNLAGGQLQNLILGANRVQDLADDLATTWKLRTGKTPQHLSSQIPDYAGLSPEQAAQRLREEIFSRTSQAIGSMALLTSASSSLMQPRACLAPIRCSKKPSPPSLKA